MNPAQATLAQNVSILQDMLRPKASRQIELLHAVHSQELRALRSGISR